MHLLFWCIVWVYWKFAVGLDDFNLQPCVCPDGWTLNPANKYCYKRELANVDQPAALNECKLANADLASFHSKEEHLFVLENIVETREKVWIGFKTTGNNEVKSRAWTDGSIVNYTDPANLGGVPPERESEEHCFYYFKETGKHAIWTSDQCDQKEVIDGFICKLLAAAPPPTPGVCTTGEITTTPFIPTTTTVCPTQPPIPTCESTWTHFDPSGSCYKVFHNMKIDESEEYCKTLGGHFVSIHSKEENDFVMELSKAGIKVKDGEWNNQVAIGLNSVEKKETYVWFDGTPLDYTNWCSECPTSKETQRCAFMNADEQAVFKPPEPAIGTWDDHECNSTMRAFVCKKPATIA